MPWVIRRNVFCVVWNSIEAGSLPIWCVNYRSVIALTLVDIHPLSCECRINGLLRVILNGMNDLKALSWLKPEKTDIMWSQPCKTVSAHHGRQEMGMLTVCPISAHTVHRRLQHRDLSVRTPLYRLLLTIQHRETATLLRRTTKLDTGIAKCRLFRRVSLLRASTHTAGVEAPRRPHTGFLHSIMA